MSWIYWVAPVFCVLFAAMSPTADSSSGSSGRVRGGRETWNLCGRLRQPSFLWPIFTGPGGVHGPLGPPPDPLLDSDQKFHLFWSQEFQDAAFSMLDYETVFVSNKLQLAILQRTMRAVTITNIDVTDIECVAVMKRLGDFFRTMPYHSCLFSRDFRELNFLPIRVKFGSVFL